MKLYSRSQVIVYVLIALVAGALIAFAFEASKRSRCDAVGESEAVDGGGESVPSASVVAPVAFGDGYSADESVNIAVYERCNEAVVNITTQVMAMNWWLEPVMQEGGSGSGSIIDKRGYVVTNCHVIENTSKIYISLADGSQYEGKIIAQDKESDIAVLKFDPGAADLKVIAFGDSKALKVGQKVIAIGNPFAFERTMTVGIVSGLGRPIQETNSTIIRNMIQTDTAINPGNSGGPLLDTKGRMIGINTMIVSTSGSSAGLGFAVPVETAKRVVQDLIRYGKVVRGKINAALLPVNSSFAKQAGLSVASGLLVSQVDPSSKSLKAGLRGGTQEVTYTSGWNRYTIYLGGDVIVAVDGIKCDTLAVFNSVLESHKPGDRVDVVVNRSGVEVTLSVTLDGEE